MDAVSHIAKISIFGRINVFVFLSLLSFEGIAMSSAGAVDTSLEPPRMESSTNAEDLARRIGQFFRSGRYAEIVAFFTPELARALPPATLEAGWRQASGSMGDVQGVGPLRVDVSDLSQVVTVPFAFHEGAIDLMITVSGGRISGLFLRRKPTTAQTWSAPAYVDPSAFGSVEIKIHSDGFDLPGTIYLPHTAERMPALVLVHGSGPNDRDESIGANRPFRDIAQGLASRGIAVLTYDKRTAVAPQSLLSRRAPTVRDEVLDDADAAVTFLRSRPNIDTRRIVVVGHSLGATLAPRLATHNPGIGGIVMLAAAARPLPDIIVEQARYLAGLRGEPSAETRAGLHALDVEAAKARAAKVGDEGTLILGAPPSWWADLNAYDPAKTAAALTIKIFVLQGARDYQVTSADYDIFHDALSGHANVTFRWFPSLNHLFIEGAGRSTPSEYEHPGHVDVGAIDAIADFVKTLRE